MEMLKEKHICKNVMMTINDFVRGKVRNTIIYRKAIKYSLS